MEGWRDGGTGRNIESKIQVRKKRQEERNIENKKKEISIIQEL